MNKLSILYSLPCCLIKVITTISLLVITINFSHANTIATLIHEKALSINTSINTKTSPVVKQPIVISVEVATNRWFAGGTRIKQFKLADAIILSGSELAINGSKKVNGVTWSAQTRELTLYPTRQGPYQIPAIEVFISVNSAKYGIVEGTILTQPQAFSAVLPDALTHIEHFIASSYVSLSIDGDFDSNTPYKVGEAVSQTITIQAENVPAMMISPIVVPSIEGISIYQKPPQVFDKSNRGTLLGTRIESNTYIFESSGTYQIPEQNLYWWNTKTHQLEQITIPAKQWQVTGQVLSTKANELWLEQLNNITIFIVLITLSLLFMVFWVVKQHRPWLITRYKVITKQKQRKLASAFIRAIKQQQYPIACQFLYQYHVLVNQQSKLPEHVLIKQLNQITYNNKKDDHSNDFTLANAQEVLAFITHLHKSKPDKCFNKALKLNR